MRFTKLTSIVIVAFIVSMFATEVKAQVNNRLPRKAIIGAMNDALRDTTGSSIKPFVCKANTKAITIEVTNASLQEDRPYLITADSLGITLEIFRGNEHVFNEFYQYRGSNFAKIMAKVKSAKLKKVKSHGESIEGGNTIVLSFLNQKGAYFTLSDKSGIMNYDGDFDGVITEITRQIPNFQAIICKDYKKPIPLKDGQVKLEKDDIKFVELKEVANILSAGSDNEIEPLSCIESPIEINLICKRCIWLNHKLTHEVNTPSREQCLISHYERSASRQLQESLKASGTLNLGEIIPKIDYNDPFEKLIK